MEQVTDDLDGVDDNVLSDAFVVFSPYNESGYVIARYDYSILQWISEETLEPVEAEEWWPVPPIGSGITGVSDAER